MGTFKELLEEQDVLILHGALGTEMEELGYDISGKLWSAKYLLEKPSLIQDIHESYIEAGADLVTTSSYQATLPGLEEAGLSRQKARQVIAETVILAKRARQSVWERLPEQEKELRPYPLISGDIGPYAAYLANASEYTGDYGLVTKEELKDFHRSRIEILLAEGVDLLAMETIPNRLEAAALIELLEEEFPAVEGYMSFTIQESATISDGTSFEEIAALVEESSQILAIGINCSSPILFDASLENLIKWTDKYLVTYPNSGEVYDGQSQSWKSKAPDLHTLVEDSCQWHQAYGVKIVGGCCRTRPQDIRAIYQKFRK